MKIRNGFVSNSSSSSFVIAVKDQNKSIEFLDETIADRILKEIPKDEVVFNNKMVGNPHIGWDFIEGREKWCRSHQSFLDELEDDIWTGLEKYAERLACDGWSVAIGSMPGNGDGGSASQNYFYHNHVEIHDDDIIVTFKGE
jgi:hypothetical protein